MARWIVAVAGAALLTGCLGGGDDEGDGGGGNGGPGPTKAGCVKVFECAIECEDQSCMDSCTAKGTAAAQQQFGDLATCITAAECSDMGCMWTNCSDEAAACGLPPPSGTLNCVELDACVGNCEWDPSCMQADCFAHTDQDAASKWDALYTCADEQGCQDTQCVQDECGTELDACVNDG